MDCPFCQIVAGERPSIVVLRTSEACAFLDTRPLFLGHTLVVPAHHRETLIDLHPREVGPLFSAVKAVAASIEKALTCDGTFVATNNRVSQSVPHLHVHVVPRRWKDGLRGFFWPRTRYASEAEQAEYGERISAALGGVH
jgi:histidine triad (HIT) family protein